MKQWTNLKNDDMRRLLFILIIIASAIPAVAQKGMNVAALFGSGYQNRKDVTEVIVEGKRLKPFKLSLFRSAYNAGLAAEMERLVKLDGKNASDKEEGMIGGKLYYAFYSFPDGKGGYRHLFFRNNLLKQGSKPETTVVYMEGKATLGELKKMF